MTAILGELDVLGDPGRLEHGLRPVAPRVAHTESVRVLALPLGRSALVNAVLASALDGAPSASGDADGLMIAFDSWVGDEPPSDVIAVLRNLSSGALSGRPVGIIGTGSDARRVSENLAWLRAEIGRHGGYSVGAGLWVDPADCAAGELSAASIDVTLVATLALFGRRVRSLAWARRALRAG